MRNKTEAVLNQLRTGEQQAALRQVSERQVSTEKVLESLKVKREVPLSEDFYLPNHSGNLSVGKVMQTPTDDLAPVNKLYVDSAITGLAGASTGAGAPASTPTTLGGFYLDTTNNILYVAMGTSSPSDWKAVLTE